jgi:hypothetical protein
LKWNSGPPSGSGTENPTKRDAKQASLRIIVDPQIEHGALNSTIHDTLYLPRVFFQQEKIVWADKLHCDWCNEVFTDNLPDAEVWDEHRWTSCLSASNFIGPWIECNSDG